jgi:hypothetical protein
MNSYLKELRVKRTLDLIKLGPNKVQTIEENSGASMEK